MAFSLDVGPYCLSTNFQGWGWDVWPSWIHYLYKASVGIGVNGACATFDTMHAPILIAANGYADFYNDWGI